MAERGAVVGIGTPHDSRRCGTIVAVWAVLVLCCLAACGRIDFEPRESRVGYRRHFVVADGAAADLPAGYSIRVPLAIDPNHALPDFADVRVVNTGTGMELPRLVDVAAPEGSGLWFELPGSIAAGGSDDYWLYYGDPSLPGMAGDPAQIFAFHDDFTGSLSKWLTLGTPSTGAGSCSVPATRA
jgi:hypothetical protein